MHYKYEYLVAFLGVFLFLSFGVVDKRPSLFIIGDSTVKNGKGKGDAGQWGWGSLLEQYLDTTRIQIHNRALGGTSSRSFINRGLWAEVLKQAKKGDYLLIQFGHNEGGPLDDTARARGTLKGVGAESKEIYNPILQKQERVHTYGWYLHKMIQEAKQKGVQVVLCSLIPRNRWQADQVERASGSYATWAAQIAQQNKVTFIDLNSLIADHYEKIGKDSVANFFTSADHTHTSYSGAEKNAQILCDAIRNTRKIKLRKYLIP